MKLGKDQIERWKSDYEFRTIVGAGWAFVVTIVFALYNGYLGVRHSSPWHGSICVYYLLLTVLRGTIIASERRHAGSPERGSGKTYLAAAACLLVLNLSLIGPYAIMVRQEKPVSMTLTAAIAMATFSTYKIIIASVNLKRRKRTQNLQLRLLRVISFIDALVSVMTLQNTLIMVNSPDGGLAMRPLTAITSGAFWLAGVVLSVAVLHAAIRNRKQDQP